MPWHIEADNAECEGFAVVKDASGEVVGCHRTETQAKAQLAALNIAEDEEDDDEDDYLEDDDDLDDRAPSYQPNEAMREEAERGLAWRQEFGRGGTEIGVARFVSPSESTARDIVNGRALSIDTIRRMNSYFARHEIDKDAEGFRPGENGYPSAGRIAWALWGGDPGQSFARSIMSDTMPNRALAEAILADIHHRD